MLQLLCWVSFVAIAGGAAWLLKARIVIVCWRWWLPSADSIALSVANGWGRQHWGRWQMKICWWRGEDDTGWGAAIDEDLLLLAWATCCGCWRRWHCGRWQMKICCAAFVAVNHQSVLAVMGLWVAVAGGFVLLKPEIHWCLLRCQSGGCRWSVSEVTNRRGSMDWCVGLLGGGSTAVTGWDAVDGRGAAAGKPDYSRGWWIVFFFCNQNSRCFFFWTMTIFF